MAAASTVTLTPSPTITASPTITLTSTLEAPMVSVSVNTNCRTGPDKIYDNIGALLVGEQAEVAVSISSIKRIVLDNATTTPW